MADDNANMDVVRTGVREVDEKIGGGIPFGSLGLIEGQSDAGKSVLTQHLVYGALTSSNASVAYYTTENTVRSLILQMDSLSLFTLDHFLADRLRIYPVTLESNLRQGKQRFLLLSDHLRNLPKRFNLLIVDSVTLLVAHSNPVAVMDFFWACKRLCDEGRTVLLIAHSYAFEEEMLSRSRSLCDAHFRLKLEQVGDKMAKIMEVLKVRGADRPTGEVVTFEIEPKTGMRIIPLSKAKV